jgi:hypothetical protein
VHMYMHNMCMYMYMCMCVLLLCTCGTPVWRPDLGGITFPSTSQPRHQSAESDIDPSPRPTSPSSRPLSSCPRSNSSTTSSLMVKTCACNMYMHMHMLCTGCTQPSWLGNCQTTVQALPNPLPNPLYSDRYSHGLACARAPSHPPRAPCEGFDERARRTQIACPDIRSCAGLLLMTQSHH